MPTISTIGEFGLIHHIQKQFSKYVPRHITGIGDDCAVIPMNKKESFLVTTDLTNENIHFLRKHIQAEDLGYKALAVSLSDIAAMGGKPLYAFLSLALPLDIDVSWIQKFLRGFKSLALKHDVSLLGGDTTRSTSDITIDVMVIGTARPAAVKYRASAKSGDILCVTGLLGDSGGGLQCLLQNKRDSIFEKKLIQRHCRPRPHISEGQWLSKQKGVHAMMDISDGIISDIQRIREQSHCGIDIDLNQLPISVELTRVAQKLKFNAREMAVTGGEDYCLLVSLDLHSFPSIATNFKKKFAFPLTPIGHIRSYVSGISYYQHQKKVSFLQPAFQHFK